MFSEQSEKKWKCVVKEKGKRSRWKLRRKGLIHLRKTQMISLLTLRLGANGWEGVAEAEEITVHGFAARPLARPLFEMEEHRCVWSTDSEDVGQDKSTETGRDGTVQDYAALGKGIQFYTECHEKP